MQTYDTTVHAAVTLSSQRSRRFPMHILKRHRLSAPSRRKPPMHIPQWTKGEEDRSTFFDTHSSERLHQISYVCAEMTPTHRGDEEVR
jgi:hypothetical protein